MVDMDDLALIRQRLEESDRVDARRIELDLQDDVVILKGSVAEADEASAAQLIVEQFVERVENQLRIDRNLREGVDAPVQGEPAVPVENEVLVGSTDMLAGPDAEITSDIARALEENEPWDPPDQPSLAPVQEEYGGAMSPGDASEEGVVGPEIDRSDYAAADLTREDLEAAARGAPVPSLDPDAVVPPDLAQPDPVGVDSFGGAPSEDLEPYPERVPGAPGGVGATGEGTAGGGSISGVPATETGAVGADAASADPARSTGGTMSDAGTSRGPESREDEPLREEFPTSD